MAVFSQRSLDNLKGVHPKLVGVLNEAIRTTPIDFTVVEGLRTLQRQQELYAIGRTKAGSKVTNADGIRNKSNHQAKNDGYGHAVDIYPFVSGKVRVLEPYVIDNLRKITAHIKAVAASQGVKITCGIDWKNPFDPPHVELSKF